MRTYLTKKLDYYISSCRVHKKAVRIYAEGDSWFDYIGSDVLTEVYDQAASEPILFKHSSGGDEAAEMLGGKQRHSLVKELGFLKQHHYPNFSVAPEVILFSAGGNDLVGMYDFPMFIRKAANGSAVEDFINSPHLHLRMQQIAMAYIELGYMRDRYFPGIPIITHQYDWPVPSDQGVELLGLEIIKSWMKPYMDGIHINMDDQKKIVRYIMGGFAGILEKLRKKNFNLGEEVVGIDNFHIAPTQGTLDTKKDWANEIHPTPEGFAKIGKVVLETIRQSSPDLAQRI